MGRKTTMADIAEHADVSATTVSRVLAGSKFVASDTRTKVLAAVEELGYRPNRHAQGLAAARHAERGRQAFNAVVTLRYQHAHVDQPRPADEGGAVGEIFHALVDALQRFDMGVQSVTLCWQDLQEGVRPPLALRLRNFDGLVVYGSAWQMTPEAAAYLEQFGPVVLVASEPASSIGFPTVLPDNEAATRGVVRYLHGLGHRKIGFVRLGSPNPVYDLRLDGVRAECAALGLPAPDRWLVVGREAVSGRVDELMARGDLPTAFVGGSDGAAMAMISELGRRGVAVPDHVSVTGFDDQPWAAVQSPPLTTVRVDRDQMGRYAVRALMDLIQRGSCPEQITASSDLVIRGSTGPAPAR